MSSRYDRCLGRLLTRAARIPGTACRDRVSSGSTNNACSRRPDEHAAAVRLRRDRHFVIGMNVVDVRAAVGDIEPAARGVHQPKQIYIDNLDGRIEDTLFNALTAEFREQERKVSRALELRHEADLSYMDEGIALMSIGRGARRRFLDADLSTKKHMISGVLSNCSFRDRKISATYRKPFDILVENAAAEVGSELGKAAENGGSPKWQGRSDSNRGPSVLETDALTN
jgi:hypothetical protein